MSPVSRPLLILAILLSVLRTSGESPPVHAEETGEPLPGFWVDDDLEKGLSRARKTGKPLLAVFRCPP